MLAPNVDVGKQITFFELFNQFQKVSIPIIQRDYAQGRPDQEELRHEFLTALRNALDKEKGPPLDLDFVYGSDTSDGSEPGSFAPLDGQQRLTTLFLLHWYLAWKDGKTDAFQEHFVCNQSCRFTYEVRPSSHDFFSQLALNIPTESVDVVSSVRALIEDRPWFFRSWMQDPTIVSALTMLEHIHLVFNECINYYERLISTESPRITFQLLELRDFGLSDDLYIKMNARGKPLTQFETFKARLEQHLGVLLPDEPRILHGRKVGIAEYFSHRMDTAWADLFWEHRDSQTHLYDDYLMRLIKAVALVCLDPTNDGVNELVSELRLGRTGLSFARLLDAGCLSQKMLETLIRVLDYWSEVGFEDGMSPNATSFDSRAAFMGATSNELSYPELVKFAAYCAYIRTHEMPIDITCFSDWLRVMVNIIENSDIERPSDYVDAIRSLTELEEHSDNILEYLAENLEVTVFNRQQVREERIKAELVQRGDNWREKIVNAEMHGYFKGQIEFLLKFSGVLDHWKAEGSCSWTEEKDSEIQEQFSEYFNKASAVFDTDGLREFPEFKWERALLTLGDYTLTSGKNQSFLQDKSGSGERRPTWKLLLRGHLNDNDHEYKRQLVRNLFDRIDIDKSVESSLDEQIDATLPDTPWRQPLVEFPELIDYCTQKMFRVLEDGSVLLISKYRTSSDHLELWSYYLYKTLLTDLMESGDLEPFIPSYHNSNSDDYNPSAVLTWDYNQIEIDYSAGQYRFALESRDQESNRYLTDAIKTSFQNVIDGETWTYLSVQKANLELTVRTLVRLAREHLISKSDDLNDV